MKKYTCLFVFSLLAMVSFAQQQNKGFFVVKGKIENEQSSDTLNGSVTCYIAIAGAKNIIIPVAENGSFEQKIETEGNQEFGLSLDNDFVMFYVKPNDTLYISFNKNNIINTFSVKGKNGKRTKELNFNLRFSRDFFRKRMNLMDKFNDEITRNDSAKASDSTKVSWANNEFNEEYDFIAKDTTIDKDLKKILQNESYFFWMRDLLVRSFSGRINEFVKYDFDRVFITGEKRNTLLVNPVAHSYKEIPQYKSLSVENLYTNPSYRDFMFSYIDASSNNNSATNIFTAYMSRDFNKSLDDYEPEKEYYLAMASVPYIPVRDWYIANMLLKNFKFGSFSPTEKVMMQFLSVCQNEDYRNQLLQIDNDFKKYISGNPVPNFTLKDENGKDISLSDFKGKVILLDFWGVYCGPCIGDLENVIPKVHEKYKNKNVVFINICVDEDNKDIRDDAIKKYNAEGINLFAKGWSSNPVCKDFNIEAIPHYILIDKNGNYADYNCAISSLLSDNNILDKVLAQ